MHFSSDDRLSEGFSSLLLSQCIGRRCVGFGCVFPPSRQFLRALSTTFIVPLYDFIRFFACPWVFCLLRIGACLKAIVNVVFISHTTRPGFGSLFLRQAAGKLRLSHFTLSSPRLLGLFVRFLRISLLRVNCYRLQGDMLQHIPGWLSLFVEGRLSSAEFGRICSVFVFALRCESVGERY